MRLPTWAAVGLGFWSLAFSVSASAAPLTQNPGSFASGVESPESEGDKVELNTATPAELQSLPGVGKQRAQAIVRYRSRRPFRKRADLMRVPGIGRRLYFQLKPWVLVAATTKK